MPSVNAVAAERDSVLVPTKMAKASCLVMLAEATKMARAKEKTMPTLAKVRSSPDAMPNSLPGAAFITAELFDGKKQPAPTAPTT